ncbi:ABC transporter permease [Brassicibacter mesophilus]|uniref:ABC transporter permease n=1 Tax=Brassicibacter mesophilus TaxID=745119 RepID=UPI003D1FB51B
MENIKNINRQKTKLFKKCGERSITRFTITFSLIVALCLMGLYLFNRAKGDVSSIVQNVLLVFSMCYLLAAASCHFLKRRIEKDLLELGHISGKTRRSSLLLLIFMIFGNVFTLITFLNLIKEEKTLEYKLSYSTVLVTTFLLLIATLNLFKEEPSSIQYMGVILLAVISLIQWICVALVGKYSSIKTLNPKLKYVGYLLIVLSLSGNILSLFAGLVIIAKVRNIGSSRNIMWIDILRRLFRNPTAVAGLLYVVFLIAISIYSFFIFDYSLAVENDYSNLFQKPSLTYPFGTDEFGRDVFIRIIFGARISLAVGFVSTMIPIIIGGFLGAIAGYYGRNTDNIIMRLLDVLYAIPGILLAIAIVAAFGANTFNLIMALSIGGIPGYARTVRAQVMQLADAEFIEAARACGASNKRIIFEDIIPNSLSPVIVRATLGIGSAVLSTSALSFLGLGVQPPTPEWGNVLKAGSEYLEFYPYLAIFPGLAIVSVVLAFNFFGDGLRDALDPKLK